jgi:dienelactone hydrolase
MKISRLGLLLLLALGTLTTRAADADTPPSRRRNTAMLPAGVERRDITIWSDGTRMAGHLYLPANRSLDRKLPAVVLCAGTGGTKEQTAGRLGPILAQHGYVALAFDYRGWGASDSRLMTVSPQPAPDERQEMTVRVEALRGQMSYAEQTEDIRAALSYLAGEPGVDAERLGLWGTSYGGGLVVWVAGNDPSVRCLVAQVPGLSAGGGPAARKKTYELATRQARGETEPVPVETGRLTGALARYENDAPQSGQEPRLQRRRSGRRHQDSHALRRRRAGRTKRQQGRRPLATWPPAVRDIPLNSTLSLAFPTTAFTRRDSTRRPASSWRGSIAT